MLKYAANRPAKNITSLAMNSSIPRTGFPIPPAGWVSKACASAGASACVVRAVASAVIVSPSVRGRPAVPGVEDRALGADLGQVEVVGRRRRRGHPLERVGFPGIITTIFPFRSDTRTFQKNGSMAKPMTKPPMVAARLSSLQPLLAA